MCTATTGRILYKAMGERQGPELMLARQAAMTDLTISTPVGIAAAAGLKHAGEVRNENVKKEREALRIKQASLTPEQIDAAFKKRAEEVKKLSKRTPAERYRDELDALLAKDEEYIQQQKNAERDLKPGTPEFEAEKQRRLAYWRSVAAARKDMEESSNKAARHD